MNRPLSLVDPSGFFWKELWDKVKGWGGSNNAERVNDNAPANKQQDAVQSDHPKSAPGNIARPHLDGSITFTRPNGSTRTYTKEEVDKAFAELAARAAAEQADAPNSGGALAAATSGATAASGTGGSFLGSLASGALDLLGKVWNLPNTAIGLVVGGVGHVAGLVMGTDPGISIGNNGIQFTNNPLAFAGAITLGNAIVYGPGFGPDFQLPNGTVGDHERQHTYQGQLLGPLYLPSNILGIGAGLLFNGDAHGPANWNEVGPQANPPRPWGGRMSTARIIVGIVAACILGGCSMPYRIILHNRSDQVVVVELPDGAKTTIEAGGVSEFVFNESFMRVGIIFDNAKRFYAWRYPPKDLMDESRSPRRFAVSMGADGKIYAEKILRTGEVQSVPKQPNGFPLLPEQ